MIVFKCDSNLVIIIGSNCVAMCYNGLLFDELNSALYRTIPAPMFVSRINRHVKEYSLKTARIMTMTSRVPHKKNTFITRSSATSSSAAGAKTNDEHQCITKPAHV